MDQILGMPKENHMKLLVWIILLCIPLHAANSQALNSDIPYKNAHNTISAAPAIQALLKSEAKNLTKNFPYRINLFTQGSSDVNKAGLRLSETAKQFFVDNAGLLFYYQLLDNAMRVPHWHSNATETGTVLEGKMRITIWEGTGEAKKFTVEKNGTWIIPKAKLHALENVGPDQLNFIVAYDSPNAADRDFLTAWASLPDALLARSIGLSEKEISTIQKTTVNRLSKYDPAATPEQSDINNPLSNNFLATKPLYQTELGSITRIDSTVNPNIKEMALQRTIMKPGVLRIPHWYTSGDILLYVLKGIAFFTMMDDGGKVYHTLIKPGDVISIPVGNFHGFLNIGNEDLEIYESFNHANDIGEITLMNGVQHFDAGVIQGASGLPKASVEKIINNKPQSYMMAF